MPYHFIKSVEGKRGSTLFIAGFLFLIIGALNIWTPASDVSDAAFAWLPTHMDANDLGWAWIVGGAITIYIALRSKSHPNWEVVGFAIGIIIPFIWAFIFSASVLFGNPYGFRGGAPYYFISIMMWHVSGWADPRSLKKAEGDEINATI